MGWRERHGGSDERAAIAARARALLDTASGAPRPVPPVAGHLRARGAEVDAVPTGEDLPLPPVHAPVPVAEPEPAPAPAAEAAVTPARRGGWVLTPSALLAAGLPAEVVGGGLGPSGRHARGGPDELGPDPLGADRWAALAGPATGPAPVPPDRPRLRDRVRWDPGRRGLVAVAAVVVVVGSVAGGAVLRTGSSSAVTVAAASGSGPAEASAAPEVGASTSTTSPPATAAASTATGAVTVDVAGLVVRPGVYTLPGGSRVEDALAAAGGVQPGADLSTLNRARVLVDGEQLAVGVPGAVGAPPATAGAAGAAAGPAALVDLNTADVTQLDTLPGVGPVLAQAIVAWRTDHGRFGSVEDLDQVTGIGPTTFAKLKALVTV